MAESSFDKTKLKKFLKFYEEQGCRYIPLYWGDKKPLVSWKNFQTKEPEEEEKAAWFPEGKPVNIGIICGAASGGLVALCFNALDGAITFFGETTWNKLLSTTFVVKTYRGVHVYLRSPETIASEFWDYEGNPSWLEIRSDGNYIAAPPSLHPNGTFYEPIGASRIDIVPNLGVFLEQRIQQLGLKKPAEQGATIDAKEPGWVKAAMEGASEGERDIVCTKLAGYFKSKTIPEDVILSMLTTWGMKCSPPFPQDEVKKCVASIYRKPETLPRPPRRAYVPTAKYIYFDGKGEKLDIELLVRDLMKEYYFATFVDTHETLVYRKNAWMYNGREFIEKECEQRVGTSPLLTNNRVFEIIGHIQRETYCRREQFNNEKWTLNLENGLLDVKTRELREHTPQFMSTIRIPIRYDLGADCPKIKGFLKEILHNQDIPVIQQLFGYLLVPDYSIQRAFMFIGDGANGKSTLLRLIEAFLGKQNIASQALQQLERQRFASSTLYGKLANMHADLPSGSLRHTGIFKMLTGGDPISAEKKFKDNFIFNNYARLIFSANRPPIIQDEDSFAFWRRWIVIDFPNEFTGDRADKNIIDKLTTTQELSGLLNLALNGLDHLLHDGDFNYNLTADQVSEKYRKAADAVLAFVHECCDLAPDSYVPKDQLYDAFREYCIENRLPCPKPNAFGRRLKNQAEVRVYDSRVLIDNKQQRVWKGIRYPALEKEYF